MVAGKAKTKKTASAPAGAKKKQAPKKEVAPPANQPAVQASEKSPESYDIFDTSGVLFWKAATVVVTILLLLSILTGGFSFSQGNSSNQPTGNALAPNAVKLDFYVMSQCPYGTQVEDAIKPVLDKAGSYIDFSLNFIATDKGDGTFTSLHGQAEVEGDIVQLCAAKYNPGSYMDMIVCQNENARAIPGNWEQCAESSGLEVEKIRSCFEGDEGKALLSESIKASNDVNARGSPTMYLGGKPYSGGRTERDFLKAVCNAIEGAKPEACSDIPEPKKVNAVIITDSRCGSDCDTSRLVSQLGSIFPGLTTRTLDYSEKEAKDIMAESGIKNLPAILFDDTVKEADGYSGIERYLKSSGSYLSLQIGASFDPESEICDNEVDDDGDSIADCADPDCAQSLVCREDKENHLQVFIMSDCPYGRKAVEALKAVVDNFGDSIDYEVHYIAQESGDGFSSLHGQYEVDEDIVQLCVNKHSPEAWLDYIYCRSTKGVKGKDWKECAQETGVDIAKVESCSSAEEGKGLLREDILIAESLDIGASPTWMANNKYQFSGIDSETVKSSFCKYNEGLEGCENTLSTDTGGVPAGNC